MEQEESPFQYSPYQTLVTARARRLRTTGLMLLMFVIGMSAYGFVVLMPNLQAATKNERNARYLVPKPIPGEKSHLVSPAEQNYNRLRKALAVFILFVYGYWTVCGALIVGILIFAWLDFRELTRSYSRERNAIYMESAAQIARNASRNERQE